MNIESRFERETVDLSGFWHFRIDPKKRGEKEKWYKPKSVTGWDKIYAPASWNEQSSEYTWYMGAAWYSKDFFAPKDWSDKLVLAVFEGANYKAKVWVNGILLGEH